MSLDTDGRAKGSGGTGHHRPTTSLLYRNGGSIDAGTVPYIVLPKPLDWVRNFGIDLGAYAAVLYQGRVAYAVFGDAGGSDSMGEGSLALFEALGIRRERSDGTVIDAGVDYGVITIVFPRSGIRRPTNETDLLNGLNTTAPQLFAELTAEEDAK